MDRRDFLRKAGLVPLGLAVLAGLSGFRGIDGSVWKRPAPDYPTFSDDEAVEDILDYADSWKTDLPGRDFRDLLFRRLYEERTGKPFNDVKEPLNTLEPQA